VLQMRFWRNLKFYTPDRLPAAHLRVAHVRLHPVPERARTAHIAQVQEADLQRGSSDAGTKALIRNIASASAGSAQCSVIGITGVQQVPGAHRTYIQ